MPLNEAILAHYLNPVFVETGTCRLVAVRAALNVGFKKVRSIETSPQFFKENEFIARYEKWENVTLYLGDSGKMLWTMIRDIDEQITFWLDAHWWDAPGVTKGDKVCPLIEELSQIKKHPIKTHTILIDDASHLNHPKWAPVTKDDCLALITSINKDYHIEMIDNTHGPDEIMAVTPSIMAVTP